MTGRALGPLFGGVHEGHGLHGKPNRLQSISSLSQSRDRRQGSIAQGDDRHWALVCKDWKDITLNLTAPHKEALDLSKTNRALDFFQPRKPFYEWVEITVWGNATGLARWVPPFDASFACGGHAAAAPGTMHFL